MTKLLFLTLLLSCTPDLATVERTITPGGQPNIVVIMADDLDGDAMQVMLDLDLAPNIERLYRDGTRFPNYFISNSLCCPSRATSLLGQFAHNHGVFGSNAPDEHSGVDDFDDSSTLATWLQATGYRTAHVGKYLNGYGTEQDQTTPSFQDDYVPPGWNHWMATIGTGTYRMFHYRIHDTIDGVVNIETHEEETGEDYQTTVLAMKTTTFLSEALDEEAPFYLEVMPFAPHAEALPREGKWDFFIRHDPQDEIDKPALLALIDGLDLPMSKPNFDFVTPSQPNYVKNKPPLTEDEKQELREYYRARLKAMLAVDDLVGDVIQVLEDRGALDETVIFFTSDNGFLLGEHRLVGKRLAYDEATKVPLYVHVPDREVVSSPRLIINTDLAPTIMELAGAAPMLPADGRSLLPFLSAEVPIPAWRKRTLLEHWQSQPNDVPTYAGIRSGKWLFVDYYESTTKKELYDLDTNPYQTENLYDLPEHRATGNYLQGVLSRYRLCAGAECRAIEEE